MTIHSIERAVVRRYKEQRCYVDVAAEDLAKALQGPVGRTIFNGDRGAIVDILACSLGAKVGKCYESAWLCLTTRERPFAVITTISRASTNWQPALQRFEDIASVTVTSPEVTEPGAYCVLHIADPRAEHIRPFRVTFRKSDALDTPSSQWLLECITTQAPIDDDFRSTFDAPPGASNLRRRHTFRAFNPEIDIGLSGSLHVREIYLVIKRIGSIAGHLCKPAQLSARVEYAVSRTCIRGYEASTMQDVLAFVPAHAATLGAGA